MSSSLRRGGEDFPRLNGSNFPVWNARIRAALDGRGLLGFIDQADYDGQSESSIGSSDEDTRTTSKPKTSRPHSPSLSDDQPSETGTLPPDGSDDEGAPQADLTAQPKADGSSSEAPSASSSGNSSEAMATELPAKISTRPLAPPMIKSFAEGKKEKERRRVLLRAKGKKSRAKLREAKQHAVRKPSSRERRRMKRKTRSFLISTIDDAHVLFAEGCITAYDIYQKLRDRYEGWIAHGDPYYSNHYLVVIKYEEGTDLMSFFLEFERALKGAAEATGIVMTDEQKSLYLYHAMPSSWKLDLAIWKGSKKFIPYADLKANIERKVLDDCAKRKYIINTASPVARETASETALKVVQNASHGRDEPQRPSNSCTYCQRPKHVIRDCRVLQKHLRTGTVKDGTVLPANFTIIERKPREDHNPFPTKQPRAHRSGDRQRSGASRPDTAYKVPHIYDRFGNPVNFQDLHRKFNPRRRETGLITYTTTTPVTNLSATNTDPLDPIWTVDSGCTRHAAFQVSWFTEIRPYHGSIMVGGKQKLPIDGIGDVELSVADTKGTQRLLELRDVLFVPAMKFNLLSIAQLLKLGIRVVFNNSSKCSFFVGKDFKIHAHLATNMDLFQLKATTPPKTPSSAFVTANPAEEHPATAIAAQPDNV